MINASLTLEICIGTHDTGLPVMRLESASLGLSDLGWSEADEAALSADEVSEVEIALRSILEASMRSVEYDAYEDSDLTSIIANGRAAQAALDAHWYPAQHNTGATMSTIKISQMRNSDCIEFRHDDAVVATLCDGHDNIIFDDGFHGVLCDSPDYRSYFTEIRLTPEVARQIDAMPTPDRSI